MTRTRIKICGLTRPEDVKAACAAGVDAIGFVCYPASPRHVSPEQLAQLARIVAPWVTPVLLFVNAQPEQVQAALQVVPHALLQFHGHESPAYCTQFARPFLKAVTLRSQADLLISQSDYAQAQGLLLDTPSQGFGGSGLTFDWSLLPPVEQRLLPVILAGGLNPNNVAGAVAQVQPYGVDVSSGVESSRGIKDTLLIRRFTEAVRLADSGVGAT